MVLFYSKAALLEAFPLIPARFIGEKLIEHGNYYGAYMAIVEAERAFIPDQRNPYSQLKARRTPSGLSYRDLMKSWSDHDHSYNSLEQEIEAAHQRRRREDCKSQQHSFRIHPAHDVLAQVLYISFFALTLSFLSSNSKCLKHR